MKEEDQSEKLFDVILDSIQSKKKQVVKQRQSALTGERSSELFETKLREDVERMNYFKKQIDYLQANKD